MANDKKLILGLITGITGALRKAYNVLNKDGNYPAIENNLDLVPIAAHIVVGLNKALAEIADKERFEGMSPEDIHEAQAAEKQQAIKRMLEESAEAFKKLRPVPVMEPEELDEEEGDPDNGSDDSISETYKALLLRRETLEKEIEGLAVGSIAVTNATKMLDQMNQDIADLERELVDQ